MKLVSKLLPREEKFYHYLEQLSAHAKACAHYLHDFVTATNVTQRDAALTAIIDEKAKSKIIYNEVTRALYMTFVTPFDREDIQDFSADLYKIPKMIDKVRQRLSLHGLSDERGDFIQQIALIVKEADAMQDMVMALINHENGSKILAMIESLRDLENQGDVILSELLNLLFSDERETRDFILRNELYNMLERIIDIYRDAAGVALRIVLKYS